jgi:hypothetical protein
MLLMALTDAAAFHTNNGIGMYGHVAGLTSDEGGHAQKNCRLLHVFAVRSCEYPYLV